jgi:hypothetical protein
MLAIQSLFPNTIQTTRRQKAIQSGKGMKKGLHLSDEFAQRQLVIRTIYR